VNNPSPGLSSIKENAQLTLSITPQSASTHRRLLTSAIEYNPHMKKWAIRIMILLYSTSVVGQDTTVFPDSLRSNKKAASPTSMTLSEPGAQTYFSKPQQPTDGTYRIQPQPKTAYRTQNALPLLTLMLIMAGALFFVSIYTAFLFVFFLDPLFAYSVLFTTLAGCSILITINSQFTLGLPLPILSGPRVEQFWGLIPFFFALHISRLIELKKRQPTPWLVLKILLACLSVQIGIMVYETVSQRFLFQSAVYYQYEHVISGLIVLLLLGAIIRSRNPLRRYLIIGVASEQLVYIWPLLLPVSTAGLDPRLAFIFNYPPFLVP
jgi:hypothetical protein